MHPHNINDNHIPIVKQSPTLLANLKMHHGRHHRHCMTPHNTTFNHHIFHSGDFGHKAKSKYFLPKKYDEMIDSTPVSLYTRVFPLK